MRLSLLLLSSLSSGILAAPVDSSAQDTISLVPAARNIAASFNNLDDAIRDMEKNRYGAALKEKTEWVLHHARDLTSQFNHGIADVSRGPAATATEVSSLWGWNAPYDHLLTSARNTVNSWSNSKHTIVTSGGQAVVLDLLQQHKALSKQFTDAVAKKLPATASLQGLNFANQFASEMDRAVRLFR